MENNWISVKDRLPYDNSRYLCYCQDINSLGISYYQWNCCYHVNTKTFTDALRTVTVTHWMKLPEPPEN